MSQEKIDILKRALKKEKDDRKKAEKTLKDKIKDLKSLSSQLNKNHFQSEDVLNTKRTQLPSIFQNINDAYIVIDIDGKVLKMNGIAIDMFGYDIEIEKLNVNDLVYYKDREYAYNSFENLKTEGVFNNFIIRIITKKNNVKWVQINASTIYDKENKPIASQGIIRDVTSDKRAEDLLIESENRLSSLILNLSSGILLEDEHRKIVVTNNKFCKLFYIKNSSELLKDQDYSKIALDFENLFKLPEIFRSRVNELIENKQQILGEELIMKDETILERDFIPIFKGKVYKGHLWIYKDITQSRSYRKSLESQKEKYSNIIANMNLGLIEVDNDDNILMINQSFSEMSGYSETELLGKKGKEIFLTKKEQKNLFEQNKKRLKGESSSFELNIKNKKGELKNWLISGAPNSNLKGDIIGSIGIHLDITDSKRNIELIQEQKRLLEKRNNELQEYAHIVSHDLKTPLRSIDALLSWIKSDNKGLFDKKTTINIELIEDTLEKMEQLISNVLEYSSIGFKNENVKEIDLSNILEDVKKILFIPKNITINILKKLPKIIGEEIKFQQLFLNLISNAIKFTDKKIGIIEIDVVEEKSFYKFSVKDNGIGIDKKHHAKIFKIFHFLNKTKESTGIGLSIVKKIVNFYEGDIWLESKLGIGTIFYFTIKK
tara:strand:- start:64450 stop:66429 length:1980 start_codon:yes stop_codon:yes gene_type:complete